MNTEILPKCGFCVKYCKIQWTVVLKNAEQSSVAAWRFYSSKFFINSFSKFSMQLVIQHVVRYVESTPHLSVKWS